MRPAALLLLAALAALAVPAARAQHDHALHAVPAAAPSTPATEALVARLRASTAVFQDLSAAIEAGYRPLGPDMPNMGEHWVNPGLAIAPEIDLDAPAVLTYVRVGGRPVLTGVAYTRPVRPGEALPDPPLPTAWHYHAADLEMEAHGLVPHGHGGATEGATGGVAITGVRLAMIHAWVWAENPVGVFRDDHWGLSFLKLGLAVPPVPAPDAAKALFVLAGGRDYYARMFELAGLSDAERLRTDALLDAVESATEAVAAPARTRGALAPADLAALTAAWVAFRADVHALVGADRAARFGML